MLKMPQSLISTERTMTILNRTRRFTPWLLCALLVGLVGSGCTSLGGGPERTVGYWQAEAARNPGEAEPYRELGILYLRRGDLVRANQNLEQAFARDEDDAATLYFLGVTNEQLGKDQTALRLFERYRSVPSGSPYRGLMEGRYEYLVREQATQELRRLLTEEDALGPQRASPNVIAVFPLEYQSGDDRYAPLGRGLAEMLSVDLAQVRGLTVVERVRLQALLDELRLGRSEYVDGASAPRVGRLLEAGRLIGGTYSVVDGDELRLDAALWDAETAEVPEFTEQNGALRNLFRLQKELVFQILDELGIEPTPEERERIERVPTESIQAFLAYSRGLEQEDAGAYGEAAQFFREAAATDPTFEAAAREAEHASEIAEVAGTPDKALEMGFNVLDPLPVSEGLDLLDNRVRILNGTLGAGFIPGLESREPATEATTGGVSVGILPDPPPPPSGQ